MLHTTPGNSWTASKTTLKPPILRFSIAQLLFRTNPVHVGTRALMGRWQNCLIYLNQWKSLTLCLKIHRLRQNRYGSAHLFEEALLSKMDPNVVSSYRHALSSISRQLNCTKSTNGIRSLGSSPMTSSYSFSNSWYCLLGCEDKIVIYFTSLRGIRKTYEDCCSVRIDKDIF